MSNPYQLSIRDLAKRPGDTKVFSLDITLEEGFGNAVIGIPTGGQLHIEGRVESLHDGALVTAEVDAEAVGECVRCLIEVREPIDVDFQELFAYPGTSDFDYFIQDDSVDLEQVVRDTMVPALPFQPVCQEDCEGLCPVCGVRLLDDPGHQHEAQVDPRWAALEGLSSPGDEKLPE